MPSPYYREIYSNLTNLIDCDRSSFKSNSSYRHKVCISRADPLEKVGSIMKRPASNLHTLCLHKSFTSFNSEFRFYVNCIELPQESEFVQI